MRWLLAGCCGLALINISVAINPVVPITQKPRFYGVETKRNVGIYCLCSTKLQPARAEWYKVDKYDVDYQIKSQIKEGKKFVFHNISQNQNIFLFIRDVRVEDSGVYFCKIGNEWGPGTAVQVARPIDVPQALYRTKMKDGLIILQGLVLAVCIAAVLLRKRQLLEKRDIIYEEPETDHIYEGLAIETCGGDLYEELSPYAEAEGTEAPWE
ncbi:B-cell antigen receptor complex-associated protein beta chain isoform X2 [Cottoperca gobio]|uniref:B-cell antigen receptor complex-associated protein beta chain isoform X2 n=1 Tax=Cottoperca gobio TaxID=56716 RepID=A0A6J2RS50_COTGO|nr:B-cell antigen receptor complex-associated protein beta chain isoform X2 [Cottoperca gobio]